MVRKFPPKLRGERRNRCWTFQGAARVIQILRIWCIFLYVVIVLINGIGSMLGDVEGLSLGGDVGYDPCVCTLGGCKTGSTLISGAGMLVISDG